MNLTSVDLTNGVPTAGTGTVSTIDALLARLPGALAANGGLKVEGASFSTSTTATSGTTGYIAGDVVGGALDFGVLGPSAGIVEIVQASLQINSATLISGQGSYRLHFYNVTPTSAIADSSQWDFATADQSQYLGYVDLGTIADMGNTLFVQQENIGHRCKLSGTHLFGYLVSNGIYTPTAQSHIITIHTEQK